MKRKTLIYKTGVEYGDYTLNHVLGCSHGCKYPCYAFLMAKRFGKIKSYDEWCNPQIVENTIELLEKELPKYESKIKKLHLCFTTDPFMYGCEDIKNLSLEILRKANEHKIICSILTKGVLPCELADLPMKNEYGITLVSLDKTFVENYEPYTAPVEERISALKYLHQKGFPTWVSIEPYPTPNIVKQELKELLETIGFVDNIIFGRLHYNRMVSEYKNYKEFYTECVDIVIKYCQEHSIHYHIKKGTVVE